MDPRARASRMGCCSTPFKDETEINSNMTQELLKSHVGPHYIKGLVKTMERMYNLPKSEFGSERYEVKKIQERH